MVSPEIQTQPQHTTTKEFYTLSSTPQQIQHHLQQQHQAIRSPTSFSSYDNDSLKDFEISNSNSNISNQRINNSTPQQQQTSPLTPKSSSSSSLTINTNNSNMQNTPQKQKHTNKVPYDPLVHTHNKPPYSFRYVFYFSHKTNFTNYLNVHFYALLVP